MDILNLSISKFRNKVLKKSFFHDFRKGKLYGLLSSQNEKSVKMGILKY